WEEINSFFRTITDRIKNTVSQKFQQLKDAVFDRMEQTRNTITNIWNKAESFLKDINLFEIGKNIIQGLIDGIQEKWNDLKQSVSNIANNVKGIFTGNMDINSPSGV